jgi:hypothetical protein
MKTLFSAKKTIVSAGAVLLAAALIIGGTYAWLVVGGGETGYDGETPRLEIDTYGFSAADVSEDAQFALQPGVYYTNDEGYIKNTGGIAAFVEIEPIEIQFASDVNGKKVAPYAPTATQAALVSAGFAIDPADPENVYYVNNGVKAAETTMPGIVYHWVIKDGAGNVTKTFLDMPASGDYNLYDYDPVTKEETYLGSVRRDVGVKVETYIDLATNVLKMDGKWNGFIMRGFNVRATQAAYEDAIETSFGIDIDDLLWAEDSFIPLSAGGAYVTPQEILRAQFAAAL